MELNLQPLSTTCFVSGQPFTEGARVASFLVRDPQSPEILPGTFELADFTVDLEALDQLRPVFARIAALAGRADDTEMALGSDIYSAALEGYRYAKLAGKGAALDELKAQASVRFARQGKRKGAKGGDQA